MYSCCTQREINVADKSSRNITNWNGYNSYNFKRNGVSFACLFLTGITAAFYRLPCFEQHNTLYNITVFNFTWVPETGKTRTFDFDGPIRLRSAEKVLSVIDFVLVSERVRVSQTVGPALCFFAQLKRVTIWPHFNIRLFEPCRSAAR